MGERNWMLFREDEDGGNRRRVYECRIECVEWRRSNIECTFDGI